MDEISALKVEVYDLSKENTALKHFITAIGQQLGIDPKEISIDRIAEAIEDNKKPAE